MSWISIISDKFLLQPPAKKIIFSLYYFQFMTVFAFGFLSHQLFVYNLSSSYFVESYLNFSGSLDPVVTRNLMDSAVCLQKVQNQRKVLNGLYGQVCGNSDVVISLFGFSFSDKFYHAGVIIEFLLKMTSALISCLFTIRF